jgi:hypothetical protein
MKNIIQEVKDEFEDLKNISSMLEKKTEFDAPCPSGKIEEWEKTNGVKIPEMYKSWLLLTSYARIMDGGIELFFPEISTPDKEDVYIGSLGYGSDSLYFSQKTGAFYAIGDDREEYEDFLDFLTYVHVTLEDEAEEEYGEEWLEIYDEKFGDE